MFTFKLDAVLNELGITKNRLAVESKIRPNTVADLTKGEVSRIDFYTLQAILDTLNQIADAIRLDRRFDLNDIVQYEYNGEGKRYDRPDIPLSVTQRAKIIVDELQKSINSDEQNK